MRIVVHEALKVVLLYSGDEILTILSYADLAELGFKVFQNQKAS
jgi:hypothetical protein